MILKGTHTESRARMHTKCNIRNAMMRELCESRSESRRSSAGIADSDVNRVTDNKIIRAHYDLSE